jgi:hypothetical protein
VNSINPGDVTCWIGCVDRSDLANNPVDTAYLLVKWTDDKAIERGDSVLIWAYVWNTKTPQGYAINKYSIDMLRAVANGDCRFSVLLQNTGGGNFAVGGFGYNFDDLEPGRVPLEFDSVGAQGLVARDTIQFRYTGNPNCATPYNQFVTPDSPFVYINRAIIQSAETGVIKHPLDAAYGYPAYDYDFWVLEDPGNNDHEWQAGWNYNYWSFNIREGLSGSFTYPANGVATQLLNNNSVHYFVFASADYNIPVNLDGDYSNPDCCTTSCTNCSTSKK